MEFVNSYYILEADFELSFPRNLYKENEVQCFSLLKMGNDDFGKFIWGKIGIIKSEFDFPVFVFDIRRLVCFTSTIINVVKLKEFLEEELNISLKILKLPFKSESKLIYPDIFNFTNDPLIGVSFTLLSDNSSPTIVSILTNGLTKFNLTNNESIMKKIVLYNIELIKGKGE
ncbi:hypothetical protein [Bacillus toyonensis]|uniref:hypothetical protein n=1 Tax=Bacillus toyonensis TaxID=155322 RepID=UPI003D2421C2